ncbi:hypothetical protein ACH4RA_04765 [Streptomyces smyrnaeus]|uniref:hypothetical protein n=1 Tax=Streptomyces smyrnaeus TaxID=1387713 RepID=UPI0037B3BB14
MDSAVRYVDGDAYTSTVAGYTDRYQPSDTTVTIPGAEGALAGSYSWRYFYNAETGTRTGFDQPSAGGLPPERTATDFTADGLPTSLSAGGVPLVDDTAYDPLAHPVRTEHGLRGRKLYETRDWDEHTGRLTRDTVDGQVALRTEDTRCSYETAGSRTREVRHSLGTQAGQGDPDTDQVRSYTCGTPGDPGANTRHQTPLVLEVHRLISWLTGIGSRLSVAFWSVARLR